MIALGIIAGYCVVALTLFRFATLPSGMRMLDDEAGKFHREDNRQRWRDSQRGFYVFGAFAVAMFWPITLPASLIRNLIMSSDAVRTPTEIERARLAELESQRAELEKLRKLAREFKLSLGDDSIT